METVGHIRFTSSTVRWLPAKACGKCLRSAQRRSGQTPAHRMPFGVTRISSICTPGCERRSHFYGSRSNECTCGCHLRVCTYLQDVLFRDPFRNRREVQRELLAKISILSPQRRERAVRKHARVVHFPAVWSKCTLSLHVLCQNISLFPCSLFALSVPPPSLLL